MTDLPPFDQPQAYVVVGPDDQRGPYTLELLISEVVAGRLNDATPVWWPGLADWTTMAGHPGVAADIARRRNPSPAPEPAAFAAPPVAPAPPPPEAAQPAAPTPGQHQQAEYGYGQSGGGYPAAAAPGQDFSTGTYAAEEVVAAEADVSPEVAEEPVATVSAVDQPVMEQGQPVEAQDATELIGDAVAAEVTGEDAGVFGVGSSAVPEDAIEVPSVDVTPADFASVGQEQAGFRASGAAEGLDPEHGAAFADLIVRSRARADAAAIVDSIDGAVTDAVGVAATGQGFEAVNREDVADRHEMTFRAHDGTTAQISVSKVTGHAMAVRDGHVNLDLSCTSSTYSGEMDAGTGEHGEIVVRSAEYGGATLASVSLMLPLADYVSEEFVADEAALRRDIAAAIASVKHRLD